MLVLEHVQHFAPLRRGVLESARVRRHRRLHHQPCFVLVRRVRSRPGANMHALGPQAAISSVAAKIRKCCSRGIGCRCSIQRTFAMLTETMQRQHDKPHYRPCGLNHAVRGGREH